MGQEAPQGGEHGESGRQSSRDHRRLLTGAADRRGVETVGVGSSAGSPWTAVGKGWVGTEAKQLWKGDPYWCQGGTW